MPKVKVYGIQRSGNNWLMWLLAANYRIELLGNHYGWTHGAMEPKEVPDATIVISKHPLEWLPSMWRYAAKRESFENFVRRGSVIEGWNGLYRNYLDNAPAYLAQFVRYDDLLTDPGSTLAPIMRAFERKPGDFRTSEGRKMDKHMRPTEKPFSKEHYLTGAYLQHYSHEFMAEVEERFDWRVAGALGYERRTA